MIEITHFDTFGFALSRVNLLIAQYSPFGQQQIISLLLQNKKYLQTKRKYTTHTHSLLPHHTPYTHTVVGSRGTGNKITNYKNRLKSKVNFLESPISRSLLKDHYSTLRD